MTTDAMWIKLDAATAVHTLQHEAVERVNSAEGELVLDFTSIPRIDPAGVRAMAELADLADAKSVKVVLTAVNGDIYKVLKLMKLGQRFSYPA